MSFTPPLAKTAYRTVMCSAVAANKAPTFSAAISVLSIRLATSISAPPQFTAARTARKNGLRRKQWRICMMIKREYINREQCSCLVKVEN